MDNLSYSSSEDSDTSDKNEKTQNKWTLPIDKNPYKKITRRIDAPRIRSQKKDIDVTVSTINEVVMDRDNLRAGAIIYTRWQGLTYFCLGVDTESGNLTDFGGGVKKDETIIQGGLRELAEESLEIFENPDVEQALVFHSSRVAIMFIPMDICPEDVTREFTQKIKEHPEPEVCDIVWLTTEELLESIHGRGRTLYIVVRKILSKVVSVIKTL